MIKHARRPIGVLTSLLLIVAISFSALAQSDDQKKKKGGKRAAPPLSAAPNHQVLIPNRSFGKEYIMSGSMIPQAQAATSTGLAGKIVRFEQFHDGVDLYESIEGMVVTKDLPARRLITTFPIVKKTDAGVIIDFNAGMDRVFNDIWYATNPTFSPRYSDTAAELSSSRVFSVKREGKTLSIRQAAQARDRQRNQNEESRFEIRYFIAPYQPGKLEPKENTKRDSRYLRFFESQPRIEDTTGRNSAKIALFDISKPVTFYYSANTPEEYQQAVKDGILYWNRAFGREVVHAEKAPAKVTAPDAAHNVVQWVPWDNAGFAYADILVDPRTGESRRGQAFMTSVFAISGKARARRMHRAMEEVVEAADKGEKEHDHDHHHAEDGGRGHGLFSPSSVCQLNRVEFAKQFAGGLKELLANDELSDEAVLMASQDYVREVVAHEVGHVLGLRHNFAGSLEATLSHKELDEWFQAYLTGKDLKAYKDKLSSSSMMEYTVFKGGCFIGWLMRETDQVLPHDKAAIQWGYFDKTMARDEKMLYATDRDDRIWSDVTTFDFGTREVVAGYSEIAAVINGFPAKVIETFIAAKAPKDKRDVEPLEAVNLSPRSYAISVSMEYSRMLKWFRSTSRSLRIENDFAYVGDLNREERMKAHWASLKEQVTKLNGVDQALFSYLPTSIKLSANKEIKGVLTAPKVDAKALAKKVGELLESPAYKEFVGLDDEKHSFTDEEKKLIKHRAAKLFEEVEKQLISYALSNLSSARRDLGLVAEKVMGENDIVSQLEKRIIDLASYVVMAKGTRKISGKLNKSMVTVTDFKYDLSTRLAAARMLGDSYGSFSGWSKQAKSDLNKKLKGEVDGMLNSAALKSFRDSMLSRPLREWYLKQQSIQKYLPVIRTSTPPPSSSAKK